jgi:hypothetical protein
LWKYVADGGVDSRFCFIKVQFCQIGPAFMAVIEEGIESVGCLKVFLLKFMKLRKQIRVSLMQSCFFAFKFFEFVLFNVGFVVFMKCIIVELPYTEGMVPHHLHEFRSPFFGSYLYVFLFDV